MFYISVMNLSGKFSFNIIIMLSFSAAIKQKPTLLLICLWKKQLLILFFILFSFRVFFQQFSVRGINFCWFHRHLLRDWGTNLRINWSLTQLDDVFWFWWSGFLFFPRGFCSFFTTSWSALLAAFYRFCIFLKWCFRVPDTSVCLPAAES